MEKFKLAISSTGTIAHRMAMTVAAMEGVEICAVGSRTLQAAQAFAQEYGIEKAYGSYEQLAADPEPQLIYVASPHSHHLQHSMLYLEAGKPVLCEKAFTVNAAGAEKLVALAKAQKLFLCEALWTRFQPLTKTIRRLVANGAVGNPLMVCANAGQYLGHISRITSPNLAGGALMDLSIYPINLASVVLGGDVQAVQATATMLDTGVDCIDNIVLQYPGGTTALLASSMMNHMDPRWYVYGEDGLMEINGIYNPLLVRVQDNNGGLVAFHKQPPQISGYEYELEACIAAIREGRDECDEMPHAETLRIMRLLDSIRESWGLRFPFETEPNAAY